MRSTTHATDAPMTNVMAALAKAKIRELRNKRRPARIGLDEIFHRQRARTESGIFGKGVGEERGNWDEYEPHRDREACEQHV